jgi:hypothetical protein
MLNFVMTPIMAQNKASRIYDFPVNPNTEEWKNLKREKERINALQIPDELLQSMTTDDLIITCMNYPAFGHFTAYNSIEEGISRVIKNFNGLRELLVRKDASSKMLSLFSSGFADKPFKDVNPDFWDMRADYFKLLFARDEIIDNLSADEKLSLLEILNKRLSGKIEGKEQNSLFEIQSEILMMAKVLDKSDNADFKKAKEHNASIDNLLNTGEIKDLTQISDLMEITDNIINLKTK